MDKGQRPICPTKVNLLCQENLDPWHMRWRHLSEWHEDFDSLDFSEISEDPADDYNPHNPQNMLYLPRP